jgi:hypothetical protein
MDVSTLRQDEGTFLEDLSARQPDSSPRSSQDIIPLTIHRDHHITEPPAVGLQTSMEIKSIQATMKDHQAKMKPDHTLARFVQRPLNPSSYIKTGCL